MDSNGVLWPPLESRLWKLKHLACLVDAFCPQLNEKTILHKGYYFQIWVSCNSFHKNHSGFRESGGKYRKVKFSRGMVTVVAFEGLFFYERSGWCVTCRQILSFLLREKNKLCSRCTRPVEGWIPWITSIIYG